MTPRTEAGRRMWHARAVRPYVLAIEREAAALDVPLLTQAIQLIERAGMNGPDSSFWRQDADEWLIKARRARLAAETAR